MPRPTPILLRLATAALGVTMTAACRDAAAPDDILCTMEARAGIVVVVRDADTQAGLAAIARGSATDGAYVDSLRSNGSATTMSGAYERPGTYVVDVRASGYQPFTTTGIRVTKDQCHVITQTVTVALQRARS